jgi:hypothetical protein
MKTSSKYFDSIRINPGGKKKKKRRKRSRRRQCQWAGCDKPGGHKAPAGRDREGQYFNFCMDHVREYNKNYNYFSGLSDSEVSKFQKDSLTGNRPTWKMGTANARKHGLRRYSRIMKSGSARSMRMRDPNWQADRRAVQLVRKLKPLEAKAMSTLGLKAERDRRRHQDAIQGAGQKAPPGRKWRRPRLRGAIPRSRAGLSIVEDRRPVLGAFRNPPKTVPRGTPRIE